jgi:hypothetical protein
LFSDQEINQIRLLKPGVFNENVVMDEPEQFFKKQVRLLKTDHRNKGQQIVNHWLKREAEIDSQTETQKKEKNVVPIGIILAEGEWLTQEQIKSNLELVKKGKPQKKLATAYEKLLIATAIPLKTKFMEAELTFEMKYKAAIVDKKFKETPIEIDVSDGKGFQPFEFNKKLKVQYDIPGDKAIAIKMRLPEGEVISYGKISVMPPMMLGADTVFEIQAEVQAVSKGKKNSLMNYSTTAPAGGIASINIGHDQRFDKPCIILAGIDPFNDNTFKDFKENYSDFTTPIIERLKANGYDIVYLDYNDSRTDIRTNAAVLERLINWVNANKIGNEKGMVIGQSMGGIVARYALRSMEIRGINHHIETYISFDAPHLGANIPPGAAELLYDLDDVWLRDFLGFKQSAIDRVKAGYESMAARQLIIRHNGPNPNIEFTRLQNELNQMGWPMWNNMKRYGLSCGSIYGAKQNGGHTGPGEKLVRAHAGVFNLGLNPIATWAEADLWTNSLNGYHKVSHLGFYHVGVPFTLKYGRFTFDQFNYDIAPGGNYVNDWQLRDEDGIGITAERILKIAGFFSFNNQNRPKICFIPTFSAWASSRPRNSQSDLYKTIWDHNGYTPFHKIFGLNNNFEHIRNEISQIQTMWDDLFDHMGLRTSSVPTDPTGLAPFLGPVGLRSTNTYCQEDRSTRSGYFTPPPGGGWINGIYSVSASSSTPQVIVNTTITWKDGEQPRWSIRPRGVVGSSTVTFNTQYYDVQNTQSSRTYVFTVRPQSDIECTPITLPPPPGGPYPTPLRKAAPTSKQIELSEAQVYPNPAANTISIKVPEQKDEGMNIVQYNVSIFNTQGKKIMHFADRNHLEDLDITALPPGIYKLKVYDKNQAWNTTILKQ